MGSRRLHLPAAAAGRSGAWPSPPGGGAPCAPGFPSAPSWPAAPAAQPDRSRPPVLAGRGGGRRRSRPSRRRRAHHTPGRANPRGRTRAVKLGLRSRRLAATGCRAGGRGSRDGAWRLPAGSPRRGRWARAWSRGHRRRLAADPATSWTGRDAYCRKLSLKQRNN